jgi:hypothetical protein
MTDVIVRQTNDLRRIVDEFSKFARMPEPDRKETDLVRAGARCGDAAGGGPARRALRRRACPTGRC